MTAGSVPPASAAPAEPVIAAAQNPLLPTLGTFAAELGGFLVVLFVLWRWVVPPVQRSMQRRQDAIKEQFEESQRAKDRADAAEREYQQALAEARREASQMREQAQEQRTQIVEDAKTEAREQADAMIARAEEQIANERDRAMRELRNDLGRLATDLAERLLRESLADEERQQRVVARFLDELEGSRSGDAGTGASGERERVR